MSPVVDRLELEFADRTIFNRLNAIEPANQQKMAGYAVVGHPVIVLLDGQGQVAHRFFGVQPRETVRDALLSLLGELEQ